MIPIKNILYLYVITLVVFTEVYVFFPWMQAITIMNYVLVFVYFFYRKEIENIYIKKLQITLFIFIIYIFLINLYQNDLKKAVSIFITTFPIPFILGMFAKYPDRNRIIFFFAKFFILFNLFFSILQEAGIFITASELWAKLPIFGTYRGFVGFSETQGLRISGAGSSTISLACMLGIIFILFYFYKKNDELLSRKERIIYLTIIGIMSILTQTRSLLFSIPFVILLTELFFSKNKIKGFIYVFIGTIFFIGILYFSLPILMEKFPRLFLSINQDGSIIHRIQANVYGAIGTFYLSPIIGVPFKEALHAMEVGYHKIGLFIGTYFIDKVTYHNQLFYFFRHYGFIGLFLYIFLFYKMLKVALDPMKEEFNKKILFGIIIFYFLYTLSHNNKWTMDYYLWVFLALEFKRRIDEKKINGWI